MAVRQVVVVGGGGLMGSGIAAGRRARPGFEVTIVEVDDAAIERGLRRIERGLEKLGGARSAGECARADLVVHRASRRPGPRPTT